MKKKKIRWVFIIIPVVLIVGAVGWYFLRSSKAQAASGELIQRTTTVERGSLEVTLSGSGSVNPVIQTDIQVNVDGTVKENYMEEGKAVKAGDVLLVLNKYDYEISRKKLENTLEQKKLAYEQQLKEYEALTVTAPIRGEISSLSVEEGDEINKGSELLTIIDTSVLSADVCFPNISMESSQSKEQVMLHVPEYMTTLSAEILSMRQDGGNVDMTVLIQNPGALEEGTGIWCELESTDGSISSMEGFLEWYNREAVYAEASGTVQKINVEEHQIVSEGMTLITLYNDEAAVDLEDALLQAEEAQYDIEQSQIDADQYTITAPMDGYIVSVKEILVGDSLKEEQVICSFINTDEMEFDINIDELDINQVAKGQDVIVTAEAIEETAEEPMMGKVTNIALEGSYSNGVTSYPVTITIPGTESLKVGMNVDAEIQIVNKENVLLVPLEALEKRGNSYMVWLKTSEETTATKKTDTGAAMPEGKADIESMTKEERAEFRRKMQEQVGSEGTAEAPDFANRQQTMTKTENNYYEGAVLIPVETGLYNENYMEIVSGLDEGDIIVLPQQNTNAAISHSEVQEREGFNMPMGGSFGGGGYSREPGGGRP